MKRHSTTRKRKQFSFPLRLMTKNALFLKKTKYPLFLLKLTLWGIEMTSSNHAAKVLTPDLLTLVHFLWAVLGLMLTHGPHLYSHFVTLPCNGRDSLSVVMLKWKKQVKYVYLTHQNTFSFLVCKSVLLFITSFLFPSYCMFVCLFVCLGGC